MPVPESSLKPLLALDTDSSIRFPISRPAGGPNDRIEVLITVGSQRFFYKVKTWGE